MIKDCSVQVSGGRVSKILEGPCSHFSTAEKVFDLGGLILAPGLIDAHVHFRDPGALFKEDIESGTRSAAHGGFTTVVCMPNTSPALDSVITIRYLQSKIQEFAKVRVLFYAAATMGLGTSDTVPFQTLHELGAIGFTNDGLPIIRTSHLRKALQYSQHLGVPVAQHAEDLDLSGGGCVNGGHAAYAQNLLPSSDVAEYSMIARDLAVLASIPMAHYHALHISSLRSVGYIKRAKEDGLRVTCEITPHHFTLTSSATLEHGTYAKMNPPLREQRDVATMIEAMKNGVIDIIASDHAPHDCDSKKRTLSCASFGILGLETMLPLALNLRAHGLSIERILEMLTSKPAQIIGRPDLGIISVGSVADLCVIDPDLEWTADSFQSKSRNSPFYGMKMRGRAVATFVEGRLIFGELR